jgi:hypothetical protein
MRSLPYSLHPESGLASTGHTGLDRLMDMLRFGDNVVWHVDELEDYRVFARMFRERCAAEQRPLVYIRFGQHPPVLDEEDPALTCVRLDPREGFDRFSQEVHDLVLEQGRGVSYVFDCLSELVEAWATGEQLANFFQTACPFLYELRTIAYFALLRHRHTNQTVARIYNTTQVLIELFRSGGDRYLKLVKVWDRYSAEMFFSHRIEGERLAIVFDRLQTAAALAPQPQVMQGSPWESIQQRLHSAKDPRQPDLVEAELAALKEEFSRMLLGRHPVFAELADRFLGLEALWGVRERIIGSGRIGGKAAGMILAREILRHPNQGLADPSVLEELDSYYIGSDVFYTFLVQNQLFRLRLECTRGEPGEVLPQEEIEGRFVSGTFTPAIIEQLRRMLESFGNAPIIVRSSSLLEDSFGGAFAGKYRSEFCPNQGNLNERLAQLTRAIKLVYASSLSADALSYRKRRQLEGSEELMGVLVQRVAGAQYRNYFFPMLAGVAFSRNLYAWNDRIDPGQGVVRLVFGLGTRAVDRVGGDYPRMIALSHPLLRPEVGVEAAKYSQHEVDVINLEYDTFQTLPVRDVLRDVSYPGLHLLVSAWDEEHLHDPYSRFLEADAHYILTFNNLIRQTPFVKVLKEVLAVLERAYRNPVDIEFAATVTPAGRLQFNLLQCRPLWTRDNIVNIALPDDIDPATVLLRSHRVIVGGMVEHIRFLVYIDPAAYAAIAYPPDRKTLGRLVGRINTHPAISPHNFILIGPGRWGSSNVDLGINVSYADIDNANVLVELSGSEHGHAPEVSYGTHFFQDLVEEQIIYLPVYTEDSVSAFNQAFFTDAPNHLGDFLPDYMTLAPYLKLIDLEQMNLVARLIADPRRQEAVCHLMTND